MENAEYIWKYFKSKGFSDAGVAGLMGNLYAESGLNSKNLQNTYEKSLGYTDDGYTQAVDTGTYNNFVRDSAGYGLAQWTYWSRKQNLLNFCKQRNKSIGDLDAQLDFLYQELTSGYLQVVALLKTTTSVLDASNAILLNFERPKSMNEPATQQRRAGFGQTYYDKYHQQAKETSNMKYSDSNPPLVCMMKNSTCYKNTSKMTIRGVLWHSTGANNPNLKRYVQPGSDDPNYAKLMDMLGKNAYGNDWNHIEHQAGLNCWIGKLADGTVTTVQTMPWDFKPWGCGGGCNNGWIQFEICEDALNDAEYFGKVYKEACEITAYLCKKFNIDPHGTVVYNGKVVPTILCHHDSYKLGLGSNHGDIDHWFPKFGKSMVTVRNDVAALMNSSEPVVEEDEDMTQEKFNEMMNKYLEDLANKPATWEQTSVDWGQQNGLMKGDEKGRLMSKKFMTRGEFITVLQRFSEKFCK